MTARRTVEPSRIKEAISVAVERQLLQADEAADLMTEMEL